MEHGEKRSRRVLDPEHVQAFCRKHHIRKLSLFGSVLGDAFGPQSDLDVLVEFEPGYSVGYLHMERIQAELSEIAGVRVDMRTPAELSRYFREEVQRTAEVQYAEG